MARCRPGEDDLNARIKAAEAGHDDKLLAELLETKRNQLRRIKKEIEITER